MWGHIAASSRDENGASVRNKVVELLTPSQIAEAKDLAHQCVRKNYQGCLLNENSTNHIHTRIYRDVLIHEFC